MRLTFFAVAATPGLRRGLFPSDEPLDARGIAATRACAPHLPRASVYWTSPATCGIQSAAALGVAATPVAALCECDYGGWAGTDLRTVSTRDPAAYAAWLADPGSAPHGGESRLDLIERIGAWLEGPALAPPVSLHALAITHTAVVRAAVAYARGLPAGAHAQIAVAPLTVTALRREPSGWVIDSLSIAVRPVSAG